MSNTLTSHVDVPRVSGVAGYATAEANHHSPLRVIPPRPVEFPAENHGEIFTTSW